MTRSRFRYDAYSGQLMSDGRNVDSNDGDRDFVMHLSEDDLDDLSIFAFEDELPCDEE
jgi:hypothetical protein